MKTDIIKHLEALAQFMPGAIYWKDKNSVYLGANASTINIAGFKSLSDMVGKTDYDLWPQFADELVANDQEVMRTKQPIHKEEAIVQPDGTIKYFTAIKVPLYDDNGNIIGIIGNSIEITNSKEEAERLRIENAIHKNDLERQEEVKRDMEQLAHDIVSPMESVLSIAEAPDSNMPEKYRVTLRHASERVAGIAQRMISKYNNNDIGDVEENLLVSLALIQITNEKREQYLKSGIIFEIGIDNSADFSCISLDLI